MGAKMLLELLVYSQWVSQSGYLKLNAFINKRNNHACNVMENASMNENSQ